MTAANVRPLPNAAPVSADTPGIAGSRWLPDAAFDAGWESIVMPGDDKVRLVRQSATTMTMRAKVDAAALPLHGIVLLAGPPGTGKTTVARGLASRVAAGLPTAASPVAYIEVDPHELTSSALGRSQRAVDELFTTTIEPVAAEKVTIVLFDEVETLVTDRAGLSRQANPIDVHRACDAALSNLDRLAANCPDFLVIATTNFDEAVDDAFVSRADVLHRFSLPDSEARLAILRHTITAVDDAWPGTGAVLADPRFHEVVETSDGLDGRSLRKLVAAAAARDLHLDFTRLSVDALLAAVSEAKDFR